MVNYVKKLNQQVEKLADLLTKDLFLKTLLSEDLNEQITVSKKTTQKFHWECTCSYCVNLITYVNLKLHYHREFVRHGDYNTEIEYQLGNLKIFKRNSEAEAKANEYEHILEHFKAAEKYIGANPGTFIQSIPKLRIAHESFTHFINRIQNLKNASIHGSYNLLDFGYRGRSGTYRDLYSIYSD